MLYSYNWLREYVRELPPPMDLARLLTMTGTEVEGVAERGPLVSGVVVAEVLKIERHPNADRLRLCEVGTGRASYWIVCGADNMREGDRVALALPGAVLAHGLKIKRSRIRGVESEGMMCSESELGLKDVSSGIMILPGEAALGADLLDAMGLRDHMIEVNVMPNRADLLSMRGLALEISAATGAPFVEKTAALVEGGAPIGSLVVVDIERGPFCRRYAARVAAGVKVAESSAHMRERLEAHGIRPINNVVDATNYAMLATGHPMHAFDLDALRGGSVRVRNASPGETIETIDGRTRGLDPAVPVIADSVGPIAIAGIMGGKRCEVTDATRNVLLECACFEPSAIRRASRTIGLSTESSYRFERGVDPEGVRGAIDMAAAVLHALAGGEVASGAVDDYPGKKAMRSVTFRCRRASEVLGVEVAAGSALRIFQGLGMEASGTDEPGAISVTPPSRRADIKEEIDLIEEVARLSGYDKVPATMPGAELKSVRRPERSAVISRVKDALKDLGFMEAVNLSFVSSRTFALSGHQESEGVRILNPLTEEQSVMRASLLPSLLGNLRYNLSMRNDELRLFECAPVFLKGGALPEERWRTAGVMYCHRLTSRWEPPGDWIDFYDVKGAVESLFECLGIAAPFNVERARGGGRLFHPGRSASVTLDGKDAGVLGEIHPDVSTAFDLKRPACLFDIDIDALVKASRAVRTYRALPKFPGSSRDIAFVVAETVPYGEIFDAVSTINAKLIEKLEVFDVYCGGAIPSGKRSIALRVSYRANDRTLTGEEVDGLHARVAGALVERFGAEIRGEGA
jgi:phenylalanyl-tRNA synthetase beta chain